MMAFGGGFDRGTRIDRIDLDAVGREPILSGPLQEEIRCPGVMNIGRRDHDGQDEAQRAGQDMALDATSLLTQSIGEGCDKQLCAEEGF